MNFRLFGQLNEKFNGRSPYLALLGLFLAALLPRLTAVQRYITPDELMWVFRSVQFREALLNGRWSETIITGHPGVVTTWLGALGITLQLWLQPASRETYLWITHVAWLTPDNTAAFTHLATFLTAGRLQVAVVNSLGVVAIFYLVRQLWSDSAAWLLALLLAFDPFLAGLSGLLHVDALTTTFATLSLLALGQSLVAPQRPLGSLRFSGIMAGLAVLSKSPALLLLPFAALMLLLGQPLIGRGRPFVKQGLNWLAAFGLTLLMVLPAIWADPAHVVAQMSGSASRHVEMALRPTFFLGEVTFDHGPHFYPIAIAYRLGPVAFAGLLLLLGEWLYRRRLSRLWSLPVGLLGLWVILFVAGISIAAKKFDRYALPALPALTILAALAWIELLALLPKARHWLLPLLVTVQLVYMGLVLPYPLSAFNPLLDAILPAERVLTVGWAEAISAAGQWLAMQPDAAHRTAVSGMPPALAPFFPGQTLLPGIANVPQADYIIRTINSNQLSAAVEENVPPGAVLVHTVHYAGQDQAWVYAQKDPLPADHPLPDLPEPLSFAGRVQLLGWQPTAVAGQVWVDMRWRLLPDGKTGRYTLKLTLRDQNGAVWASLETPLLNEVYFYPQHWPTGTTPRVRYIFGLPPGIPPSAYQVELQLLDTASSAQLPVLAGDGAFQGVVVTTPDLMVAPSAEPPSRSQLEIAVITDTEWDTVGLRLLGHNGLPHTVLSGHSVPLDLFWQADQPLPAGLMVSLALREGGQTLAPNEPVVMPLSRFASQQWRVGERLHEKYLLPLPPELLAGVYEVRLQVQTAVGQPLAAEPMIVGEIAVEAFDRLFVLPSDIAQPLTQNFGSEIALRGVNGPAPAAAPGETVTLTLFWQALQPPQTIYTAFVHLVGPDGGNVTQADRWPGGLPSDGWAADQVIIDHYEIQLPIDAPSGSYQIAVGLYTAADGLRLPITDAAGRSYPDDRAVLPITFTVP